MTNRSPSSSSSASRSHSRGSVSRIKSAPVVKRDQLVPDVKPHYSPKRSRSNMSTSKSKFLNGSSSSRRFNGSSSRGMLLGDGGSETGSLGGSISSSNNIDLDDMTEWGFKGIPECLYCLKKNSEIDGMLMQCARCKLAYYCSTECWNAGRKQHEEFCITGGNLERQPSTVGFASITIKNNDDDHLGMPIKIKMWTGQTYNVKVSEHDTVNAIKDMVEIEENIAADRQRFVIAGKKLKPGDGIRSLSAFGVKKGTTIHVEPYTLPIKVKMLGDNNKKLKLDVEPCCTIDQLKAQIAEEEECDISPTQQVLSLDGKKLRDGDRTLKDYDIQYGSTLKLEPKSFQIKIKTKSGDKLKIDVYAHDTVDQLKNQVENKSGVAADKQVLTLDGKKLKDGGKKLKDYKIKDGTTLKLESEHCADCSIVIQTPSGKELKLDVDPTQTTVDDLKKQIEREGGSSGLPVDQQCLLLDGKRLKHSSRTLADYKIKKKSVLELQPVKISITIETAKNGKSIDLDVEPGDTVESLKKMIDLETRIPAKQQKLTINSKELKDDTKTLADCKIKKGTVVQVESKDITIQIKTPTGETVDIQVDPSLSVDKLKELLAQKEGVPPERQRLLLDGKELEKGRRSLSDYKIRQGSCLWVEPNTMPVKVRLGSTGDVLKLDVEACDSVSDLKNLIAREANIPAEQQLLRLDDKKLRHDDRSLSEYKIRAKSVIDLEVAKMSIKVKTPTGDAIKLDVSPHDSIATVKKLIEEEEEVPANRQRLTFDGVDLQDNRTVASYNIKKRSVLEVEPLTLPIKVKTSFGKTFNLDVDPWDTIDELKQAIAEEEGMPPEEQRILFGGRELFNGQATLIDCAIQRGDTIHLEALDYAVNVKIVPSGKIFKFYVDSDESIEEIKRLIEYNDGTEPAKQILTMQDGTVLSNDKRLSDYPGIRLGTQLLMEKVVSTLKPTSELTREETVVRRKKCHTWHGKLNHPTKKKMKELVAGLPPSCGITVDDVELLPWSTGGYALNIRKMNELITAGDA